MEEEAEKLKEMQTEVEKQMNMNASSTSKFIKQHLSLTFKT